MSVINLTPKNLSGIQDHFRYRRYEIENKLTIAKKRKRNIEKEISNLEKDLEVCLDGMNWCQEVYKAGKQK